MFYEWELIRLPASFSLTAVRGSETGSISTGLFFESIGQDPYQMMRSAVEFWIKSDFGKVTNLNVNVVMEKWGFDFVIASMVHGSFKQIVTSEQIQEWEKQVKENDRKK